MIEFLIEWDKTITVALNNLHAGWSDGFFYAYSQMGTWVPFYVCLLLLLLRNRPKEGAWVVGWVLVTVALCDGFSSGICKPLFHRLRPTHDPTLEALIVCVNDYRGGLYGFISSHAANSFGLATLLALLFRQRRITLLLMVWAALNAYSRIYLGVHFVGDILCGTLAGGLIGVGVYGLIRSLANRRRTKLVLPFQLPLYAFYLLLAVYLLTSLTCLFLGR